MKKKLNKPKKENWQRKYQRYAYTCEQETLHDTEIDQKKKKNYLV